jgi:hypothetical protein
MIEQQRQARFAAVRLDALQIGEIFGVERDDMVETEEIVRRDLTRAQVGNVGAVLEGDGGGARIGRAADMPVAGAGAVHFDVEPLPFGLGAEGGFGERRAADVAETDEQDRNRHH